MKYIKNKNGDVTIDGTPDEISIYHKKMVWRKSKADRKTVERKSVSTHSRAPYLSVERTAMRDLVRKGKNSIQIARYLWKNQLSPIKRTPSAIGSEFRRMMKDPNRR